MHFDEILSLQHHVNFLCYKLSRSLFCINRPKNFLDNKSLKMLFFALFHSNLLYCIGTLSSMTKSNASRTQKLHKSFLEIWHKNEQRNLNYSLRNNPPYQIWPSKKYSIFSFPADLDDLRFQTNKITFQIALKNNLISELSPVPPQLHPLSPTHSPHLSSVKFTNKQVTYTVFIEITTFCSESFQDPRAPTISVMYTARLECKANPHPT